MFVHDQLCHNLNIADIMPSLFPRLELLFYLYHCEIFDTVGLALQALVTDASIIITCIGQLLRNIQR